MIHKETVKAFEREYKKHKIAGSILDGNDYDMFWYPNIPDDVKDEVRGPFQLDEDEEILFVLDNSVEGSRDQGTVITDRGVTCVEDNEEPDEFTYLLWSQIERVEYDDGYLCFWVTEDEESGEWKSSDTGGGKGKGGPKEVWDEESGEWKSSDTGGGKGKVVGKSYHYEKIDRGDGTFLRSDGKIVDASGKVIEPIEKLEDEEEYEYEDEPYSIGISLFTGDIDDEDMDDWGFILAKMFTQIAKTQPEPSLDDVVKACGNLIDEGKEYEALEYALEYKEIFPLGFMVSYYIAELYDKKGQAELGLRILNEYITRLEEGVDELDPKDTLFCLATLRGRRGEIYSRLGKIPFARADLLFAVNNLREANFSEDGYNKMVNEFKENGIRFMEHFIEIPYQERKLLVPVESYKGIDLNQTSLQVISMDYLPRIEFPASRPVLNQLYVAHPHLLHKYIPFEDYEQEFVWEKIQEYCKIMQSLGATEISIDGIGSSAKSASHFLESVGRTIQMHQEYCPKSAPTLPTDVIWFSHERSWQRTYEQRMRGLLLEHEEKIETNKCKVVSDSDLSGVYEEFKMLIAGVGEEWEKSMEEQFEPQENVIISIKVKFAPLESLQGGTEEKPKGEIPCDEDNTANEEEYLEEVRTCLEGSSEMSASARRLLNNLRDKLGISVERAAELEITLQHPQLTEKEKEYMEEVMVCLDESSEISPDVRRLLDRRMAKFGISEERAVEIEDMCKMTK